jgi:putative MATE family efflux protein
MFAAIIATVSNCGLDPLFIFTMGLGVRGAGLATVVSQLIAGIYILRLFLTGKTRTPAGWRRTCIQLDVVRRIALVGFPQAAGQLSLSVGYFFFNRMLLGIDPRAVAAFSVCVRFEQIILIPILSIGTAVITMVGVNFGAGRYERIRAIWRNALFLELILVSVIVSILIGWAPAFYSLFSDVPEVTNYAVRQTRIVTPSYLMVAVVVLVRTLFQGLGRPLAGVVGNLLRGVCIAVPAALLYTHALKGGVAGVWYGIATANILTAGISLIWLLKALGRFSAAP